MAEWQQNVKTVMFYSGFSLIERSAKQRKETDSRLLKGTTLVVERASLCGGIAIFRWRCCRMW